MCLVFPDLSPHKSLYYCRVNSRFGIKSVIEVDCRVANLGSVTFLVRHVADSIGFAIWSHKAVRSGNNIDQSIADPL